MKMKKSLAAMTAVMVALSLPMTAVAATWEGVDDYDKLSAAFGDTESEVRIVLSGNITNENYESLVANEGQTYTIDGKEYTLTDVSIGGGGNVTINADIISSETNDALYTYDSVSVTVNGDIEGDDDGVDACDQSKVVVNGDVVSQNGDGVDANDDAQVTVNGDVYGGTGADGVDANDDAQVTVNGDVYGGSGLAPDEDGILASGTMSSPYGYSDGGAGIEASDNSKVTVDGDVYGGDAYGTYGYAGGGIEASDNSTVIVTGNTTGGNQIADPEVSAEYTNDNGDTYFCIGYGGDGIYMSNTADVTVGGDSIGGNASGQQAYAGVGVWVEITLTVNTVENEFTGEDEVQEITPGQVTVKGTLIGGESTGEGGHNGEAIYFDYVGSDGNPIEDFLLSDELIDEIAMNTDSDYVRKEIYESALGWLYNSTADYFDDEEIVSYQEEYIYGVTNLAAEYGVDTENITEFKDIVKAVPEEDLETFVRSALEIYNEVAADMAFWLYAVPVISTSGMESMGDARLIDSNLKELVEYFGTRYIDYIAPETDEDGMETDSESEEAETNEDDLETDSERGEAEKDKTPSEKRDDEKTDSPKTGDTGMIYVMGMVLTISVVILLGAAASMIRKRK